LAKRPFLNTHDIDNVCGLHQGSGIEECQRLNLPVGVTRKHDDCTFWVLTGPHDHYIPPSSIRKVQQTDPRGPLLFPRN